MTSATRLNFIANVQTLLTAHLTAQVSDTNSGAHDTARPFIRAGRPEEIPTEKGKLPLINLFLVSGFASRMGLGSYADEKSCRVQIDIWASSESTGAAVADDIIDALTISMDSGTTGLETNGLSVMDVMGPRMLLESSPILYHFIVECFIHLIGV